MSKITAGCDPKEDPQEDNQIGVVVKPGVPPMGLHMGYILGHPIYWIVNQNNVKYGRNILQKALLPLIIHSTLI